ncbi:MAG: RNA 2',3'-cyclic phosphodiesterase [Candidatus Micrarchaeaceae archaeon]
MRCFISIDLPQELKNKIYELQKNLFLENVTFVNKDILHLTLLFLGEINQKQIENLIKNLSKIKIKKFNIELRGLSSFKKSSTRGIIFVKIFSGAEEIGILNSEMKKFVTNVKTDEKQIPHITILRVKNNEKIWNILDKYLEYELGSFEVDRFILKRSKLTSTGAVYEDIENFNLED